MQPSPEQQREMLRLMQTIRRFEERATTTSTAISMASSIPISARRRWQSASVPRLRKATKSSAHIVDMVTASLRVPISIA